MKRICQVFMIAAGLLCLASCNSNNDIIDGDGNSSNNNSSGYNSSLSEKEGSELYSELMARCVVLGINPNASCNDVARMWELMNELAAKNYSLAPAPTRGIWGQAKSLYDFNKAIKSGNATHRATLIGAMAKCGKMDAESRKQIWRQIMNAKNNYGNPVVPKEYRYDCETFWKEFSLGNMDDVAVQVYHAVFAENVVSETTAAQQVAEYLLDNKLREVDIMLKCAGPLIEAGANVVFAFGDDLIQNGKLAYDFVELNGKLVLQAVDGNLTSETCIDALNNNLKLLTKGLKEIVPTSQDLTELVADLTADQIKALQKEIQQALEDAGNYQVSKYALENFVDHAREILGLAPFVMDFADKDFVNSDDNSIICFETIKDSRNYNLVYSDKNENVLLEAKCTVKQKIINCLITYIDDRCDLMPKGTKEGDLIFMTYTQSYFDVDGNTTQLWIWYPHKDGVDVKDKFFDLKETDLQVTWLDIDTHIAAFHKNKNGEFTNWGYYPFSECWTPYAGFKPADMTISKSGNTFTVKASRKDGDDPLTTESVTVTFMLNADKTPAISSVDYSFCNHHWKDIDNGRYVDANYHVVVNNIPFQKVVLRDYYSNYDQYSWYAEGNKVNVSSQSYTHTLENGSTETFDYDPSVTASRIKVIVNVK